MIIILFFNDVLKELSCQNQTTETSCGHIIDTLVFAIIFLLAGIVINILMVLAVVWKRSYLIIPWLVYQLSLSLIMIVGPFLLLYILVPDWNRYEKRNEVLNDYPERWQKLVMIIPNGFGILFLYILCHGGLVMQELGKKEAKKVQPKKEELKHPIYGAPNITVYTHAAPFAVPSVPTPEPSAPPKVI